MARLSTRSARLLLLIAVVISACERRREEARVSEYETKPAAVPSVPAPATPSLTEPDQIYVHLDAAHEHFLKKDLAKAGDALKAAADRLKDAAEAAPAGSRKDLTDAAHGLEKIEGDVRSGAMTSIEQLDHRLAMASAALARYHYLRATDAWVAQDARATGNEIMAAVDRLEAGTKQMGHDMSSEAATFDVHAREVGKKLADGTKMTEADVGVVMTGLGREIDKLVKNARTKL